METPADDNTTTKGKKDKRFELRWSAEQRQQIEANAKKAGMNLSEYLIACALHTKIKEPLSAELRRQVIATSKNLNQIARLANSGKLNARGVELLEGMIAGLYKALVW